MYPQHAHLLFWPRCVGLHFPGALSSIASPLRKGPVSFHPLGLPEEATFELSPLDSPPRFDLHGCSPDFGYRVLQTRIQPELLCAKPRGMSMALHPLYTLPFRGRWAFLVPPAAMLVRTPRRGTSNDDGFLPHVLGASNVFLGGENPTRPIPAL